MSSLAVNHFTINPAFPQIPIGRGCLRGQQSLEENWETHLLPQNMKPAKLPNSSSS